MPDQKPIGFCTHCDVQILSYEGLTACPNCGTTDRPCGYENDVTVKINKHELSILTFWAERWGMQMAEKGAGSAHSVYAIIARLKRNNPGAFDDYTLSWADEAEALRKAGFHFQSNLPGIEDSPPAPEAPDA